MCTSLAITDKNGNTYHGRTLEFMPDLDSWLTYYPEGTVFQKSSPDGKHGLTYTSKYAVLGISAEVSGEEGGERDLVEGMNSAGLSFSENMFPNDGLDELQVSDFEKSLPLLSIGEWALSHFASVNEVKKAIQFVCFWSPCLKRFENNVAPFHYAFYDRAGACLIVEIKDGKLHLSDNPTGVMTNGPEFQWHLTNLNNYTHICNEDRYEATLGNMVISQPDSGIAIASLPSSDTSVDRFVRAVYYTTFAKQATSQAEAINTLAHIMNRFDRTKNITMMTVKKEGKEYKTSEYTIWTTLSDLTSGEMYIRGYNEISYKKYSFSQFQHRDSTYFEEINLPVE